MSALLRKTTKEVSFLWEVKKFFIENFKKGKSEEISKSLEELQDTLLSSKSLEWKAKG